MSRRGLPHFWVLYILVGLTGLGTFVFWTWCRYQDVITPMMPARSEELWQRHKERCVDSVSPLTTPSAPSSSSKPEDHKRTVSLTLFIHGTVGSSLNILNPFSCLHDGIMDNDFSARFVRKYRNHPLMSYDQIIGPEGFVLLDLSDHDPLSAATYLIPAYDEITVLLGGSSDERYYATFGWSGLLSQRARQVCGFQLYEELVGFRDWVKKTYGADLLIDINAHSHGGNVALWLDEAERVHKKGLQIRNLVMFGSPMQVETAHCITSPIFKNVFLIYSRGDGIQCRDYFSTVERKSHSCMGDIIDLPLMKKGCPELRRQDIQIFVEQDRRRISHVNMWFLGRSCPPHNEFGLLPLMVITPHIVAALTDREQPPCVHCQIQLQATADAVWLNLADCDTARYHMTRQQRQKFGTIFGPAKRSFHRAEREIRRVLKTYSDAAQKDWRPFDTSTHILFNHRTWRMLQDIRHGSLRIDDETMGDAPSGPDLVGSNLVGTEEPTVQGVKNNL